MNLYIIHMNEHFMYLGVTCAVVEGKIMVQFSTSWHAVRQRRRKNCEVMYTFVRNGYVEGNTMWLRFSGMQARCT